MLYFCTHELRRCFNCCIVFPAVLPGSAATEQIMEHGDSSYGTAVHQTTNPELGTNPKYVAVNF